MNTHQTHDPIYGVYRVEHERIWLVTLKREGQTISRRFADSAYDSTDAALQAAIAHRDQMLREHPALSWRERSLRPRRNNTSGIPGVQRIVKRNGYAYWIAGTHISANRKVTRTFSVNLLGEQAAREKAIEARMAQLEEMTGLCLFNEEAKILCGDVT